MLETEAFQEFKQGLTRLRSSEPFQALQHMRRAVELDSNNPFYLSYLGLVVARAEHKWGEAERLCDGALRMRRSEAQLYLNLAEVYLAAGRREDAVEILHMGIKFAGRDVRLQRALGRLGKRRSPVIPFLRRANILNRNLGRLRHRTLQYFSRA